MMKTTEIVGDPDQYNWKIEGKPVGMWGCDSHVTSWRNQQYYKTSKVIIPTDNDYSRETYNKSTLKMFQNLKNELTGESLKDNITVEVKYNMYEGSSHGENRHVVKIRIVEDVSSKKTGAFPEYIQNEKDKSQKHYAEQSYRGSFKSSVDVKYDIKGILENLPKGYEFQGVGFERNDFDGGFGHSDNVVTEIVFEKIVKRESFEKYNAKRDKEHQEFEKTKEGWAKNWGYKTWEEYQNSEEYQKRITKQEHLSN